MTMYANIISAQDIPVSIVLLHEPMQHRVHISLDLYYILGGEEMSTVRVDAAEVVEQSLLLISASS